ncbi:MAG: tetratricopeptide repeat protein, partial [Thermoanaerobaculia bacterium]|nr:tetratricopeptide repeat protein [Thermoanaerobaculia bacterium]
CQDAYLLLRPWASANPEDLDARRAAAFCAVQLERPGDAEQLLSDLPQDQPPVRLLWGRLLLLKADPWGALATLRPLLDDAPPEMALDVRRTMAEAYASVGEAAKAVELLQGHGEGSSAVALQLGQAQYQSGDLDAALATLQPFAESLLGGARDGTDPRPGHEVSLIVEYGRLLVTAGRQEQAVPYLELATRVDPGRKQGWHQLGQALAAVGRREEAREALARFQEIVQGEVPAQLQEVQLEKNLEDPTGRELREAMKAMAEGRIEEALTIARREQAFSPEDIRPHLVEARILQFAGSTGEALEKADQLVQAAPESADAVYLRGVILMGLEETEAAERDLRQALELAPEHTAALNDLAVLLMNRGDDEEARTLLERALEIRPDDRLAAENLGKLGG